MTAQATHPQLEWHLEWGLLFSLAVFAAAYAWRFRQARAEGGRRGASVRHALAFVAFVLVVLAATTTPIEGLGVDYLFSAHMVQHLLLGDIAPLLLLLALSRVIMRPASRRLVSVERRLGPLARPGAFLIVWFALVYLWHIPALYQAAIDDPFVHLVEHGSFFAAGMAVWWPLIQPVPMRHRMEGMKPFAYIATAKLGLGALGLYLVWSGSVVYDHYAGLPRIWGLSALEDQNVGGAIMMVEQSFVLVLVLVVLFVRMLGQSEEDERRRERLEEAALT